MKHEGPKGGSQRTTSTPKTGGERSTRPSGSRDLAGHRYGSGAALQTPDKPGLPPVPPSPQSALHEAASRLHGQHGATIAAGAARVGIPEQAAAAVLLAEGQFAASQVDERMPLRFEPYVFFQQTGRWLVATHKDQAAEYRAFEEARGIDPAAAHQAVRMGVAQLSGSESEAAGYASPESMLGAMQGNPQAQVDGFFAVIAASDDLRDALQTQDWRAVASLRAGPGYGALGYDDALAASADAWRQVVKPGDGDDDETPKKKRKRA